MAIVTADTTSHIVNISSNVKQSLWLPEDKKRLVDLIAHGVYTSKDQAGDVQRRHPEFHKYPLVQFQNKYYYLINKKKKAINK